MPSLLQRFYFLSKLTTSLILFFILLFLGYLFLNAYLFENNNSNSVSELNKEIKIISSAVEKNADNLNVIGNIVKKNEKSFNKITSNIENLNKNESSRESIIQINKLFKENESLKNKINDLTTKINLLNNQEKKIETTLDEHFPINNLIRLIKLKVENGVDINEEIQLLHNLNYDEEKKTYITKLQILSDRNFIGLNKLNKNFDKNTSEYLSYYYLKNNKYNFIKYLSNIVSIQPNFSGDIKDETIKMFAKVKKRIIEKDIEKALNYLLLINENEIFFRQWINEANNFIEFEKTINKLLE